MTRLHHVTPRKFPDLRRTPRVSGFFDFVAEQRPALKAIFTD
jgi:hypothetical protein